MFNSKYDSFTVFDIFDVEKYCNLEIHGDHSRSQKMVPFDNPSMVSIILL